MFFRLTDADDDSVRLIKCSELYALVDIFYSVQTITDHFWPQSPDLSQNLRRRWCYPLGSSDLVGLRLAQLCLAWISVHDICRNLVVDSMQSTIVQYYVGLPGGVASWSWRFEITRIILALSANKDSLSCWCNWVSCWCILETAVDLVCFPVGRLMWLVKYPIDGHL